MIDQFHHPEDPNILILSNVKKDGKPTGLQDAGSYFHTDYSYLAVPARATTLYSRVVPKVGGDTLFANQQAAYDDLPEAMKKRIEPLYGIHHYGNRNDQDEKSRTVASVLTDEQKAKMPLITHKIARPHPVTGRKSLYAVSGSSFGIVGMPEDEARDLLDELAAHSTQPKYQLRFKYGVGDIVVWDNASLLHSATLIDPDDARTLWRITVLETVGRTPRRPTCWRRRSRGRGHVRLAGLRSSRGRHDLDQRRSVALELPRSDAGDAGELRQMARPLRAISASVRSCRITNAGTACARDSASRQAFKPLQQRVVGRPTARRSRAASRRRAPAALARAWSCRIATGCSPLSTGRAASVSRSPPCAAWSTRTKPQRDELPEHAAPGSFVEVGADAEHAELVMIPARDALARPCRAARR